MSISDHLSANIGIRCCNQRSAYTPTTFLSGPDVSDSLLTRRTGLKQESCPYWLIYSPLRLVQLLVSSLVPTGRLRFRRTDKTRPAPMPRIPCRAVVGRTMTFSRDASRRRSVRERGISGWGLLSAMVNSLRWQIRSFQCFGSNYWWLGHERWPLKYGIASRCCCMDRPFNPARSGERCKLP